MKWIGDLHMYTNCTFFFLKTVMDDLNYCFAVTPVENKHYTEKNDYALKRWQVAHQNSIKVPHFYSKQSIILFFIYTVQSLTKISHHFSIHS